MRKYSLLELLLSNHFQFIRKRSKCIWMKSKYGKDSWVKFSNNEITRLNQVLGIDLTKPLEQELLEDWR